MKNNLDNCLQDITKAKRRHDFLKKYRGLLQLNPNAYIEMSAVKDEELELLFYLCCIEKERHETARNMMRMIDGNKEYTIACWNGTYCKTDRNLHFMPLDKIENIFRSFIVTPLEESIFSQITFNRTEYADLYYFRSQYLPPYKNKIISISVGDSVLMMFKNQKEPFINIIHDYQKITDKFLDQLGKDMISYKNISGKLQCRKFWG